MCDVAIILFRILNNYRLGRCLLLRGLFLYRLFEKLILIIDNLFGLFFWNCVNSYGLGTYLVIKTKSETMY